MALVEINKDKRLKILCEPCMKHVDIAAKIYIEHDISMCICSDCAKEIHMMLKKEMKKPKRDRWI